MIFTSQSGRYTCMAAGAVFYFLTDIHLGEVIAQTGSTVYAA